MVSPRHLVRVRVRVSVRVRLRVRVSPCFGPGHCFGPCQLHLPRPAPVPAREGDGAHARPPPSWQMRTRPAHRSCCGSATAPSSARTRASWTPRPSRLGLRRRGARRRPPARSEARRAARDGLASREGRPASQCSVYYGLACHLGVATTLAAGQSNVAPRGTAFRRVVACFLFSQKVILKQKLRNASVGSFLPCRARPGARS